MLEHAHMHTHTHTQARTHHQNRTMWACLGGWYFMSERIGYTGSDPESDFSQREGHYKPNRTANEKVTRYSLPCFNCGVFFVCCFLFLILLNGTLSRRTQRERGFNQMYGCFCAYHFKPNATFSLKTEICQKRWNFFTDFDSNFTQISPLATLKNKWAPHSEAAVAANA